eukprot:TRINITY_DN7728_c0_g1_i1.p1 TRINITY_DN7728_c0_g1~~TRINITY_DN7728_c0_g1_i1.p1  ORF type:complete len:569 (+),score=167.93 TRINITY_DN7728_c0_g1_i1:339-2045(+)
MASVVIRTRGRREKRSVEAAVRLDGKERPMGDGVEGFRKGAAPAPGRVEISSESRGTRMTEVHEIRRAGGRVMLTITKTATALGTGESTHWVEEYEKVDQDPAAPTPTRADLREDVYPVGGEGSDVGSQDLCVSPTLCASDAPAAPSAALASDLLISRPVMLQYMLRRLPPEERRAFEGFASAVASVVSASYAMLREAAKQNADPRKKFAAFLKLAAAAQYTPLDEGSWEQFVMTRSRKDKRLHPKLRLASTPVLADYYADSPYYWGAPGTKGKHARPAPAFASQVAVLVRGVDGVAERDVAPVLGLVALAKGYLSTASTVAVETERAYDDVLVCAFPPAGDAAPAPPQATVEIYRNVPESDLALTLPSSGVVFSVIDIVYFALGVVPVLLTMIVAIYGALGTDMDVAGLDLAAVVVVVGAVAKVGQVMEQLGMQRARLEGMLDGWKTARRDAVGGNAIDRLAAQVVEQEAKEALLAYYCLLQHHRAGAPITNGTALAAAAEAFLTSIKLPGHTLETEDAVRKLEALGLVDGALRLKLTPKGFLSKGAERWGGLLRNHFADMIDARVS